MVNIRQWLNLHKSAIFLGILVGLLTRIIGDNTLTLWFNAHPLRISPNSKFIKSTNPEWRKETFYIYLSNRGSDPLYDVSVIAFFPTGVNVTLTPEIPPIWTRLMNAAMFAIHFIDNADKNKSGVQLVINTLAPTKEPIRMKVEIDKIKYYKDFTIKFEANYNTKIPKPILSNR